MAQLSRMIAKDPSYDRFYIPKHYSKTVRLIGASRGSITHEQLREMQRNPKYRTEGPIYCQQMYQNCIAAPEKTLKEAMEKKEYFFPEDNNQLGYDCIPKTLNFALRCPFFTHREQVVRLINKAGRMSFESAEKQKIDGGVSMSQLYDFIIVEDRALTLLKMTKFNLPVGGSEHVLDYVKRKMLDSGDDNLNELLVVFHGTYIEPFSHSAVFIAQYVRNPKTNALVR